MTRTRCILIAFGLAATFAGAPALAVDTNFAGQEPAPGETPPGFAEGRTLVESERFAEALPLLKQAEKAQPANADVLNQLGFVSRKLGDFAAARSYYDRALAVAPAHRGAREYRGELFVQTGDLDAATADLAALERICGPDCEEFRELRDLIAVMRRPDGDEPVAGK